MSIHLPLLFCVFAGGGVFVVGVVVVGVLASGSLSRCPTYTHDVVYSPFAAARRLTLTPCRVAMRINESPGRTVYVPPGLETGGVAGVGDVEGLVGVAAPGILSRCPV